MTGRPARFLGFLLLCFAAGVSLAPLFASHLQAAVTAAVFPQYLRLDFGSTPLAWPFLAINAGVMMAAAVWGLKRGSQSDGWRLAAFGTAMTAVLLAQSLAAFVLAWETMSLVSAFLVATYHQRRSVRRATFSYVLVSQIGAICIVAALGILAVHAGSGAFADISRASASLTGATRIGALTLALVGFGSKAGLVPLQFWLPRAHPAAPANASAMLSGVMLKIAVYGLLLACFTLAAPAPWAIGVALLIVGSLSALIGALYASIESDVKRLLAFSSIENVGIIVATLGLAVLAFAIHQNSLGALALVALLFHAVNHAAFKSLLFLAAGTLSEQLHVTNLDQLGGLAFGAMRRSAPWVLVGCIAASALPPLNGFASEWLAFNAFIRTMNGASISLIAFALVAIAALATAGGLAAAAFVKMYATGFLGDERHPREETAESFDASVLALALLAAVCLVIGVFPALVVRPIASLIAGIVDVAPLAVPNVSLLPALAVLPLLGGVAAFAAARLRGVRVSGTWTCGSTVTRRSQYTATVLTKPIRLIFHAALLPERQRIVEYGASRWLPVRITYTLSTRYLVDEAARRFAAFVQLISRRTRIVQAGFMRVYLAYALAALIAALAVAR